MTPALIQFLSYKKTFMLEISFRRTVNTFNDSKRLVHSLLSLDMLRNHAALIYLIVLMTLEALVVQLITLLQGHGRSHIPEHIKPQLLSLTQWILFIFQWPFHRYWSSLAANYSIIDCHFRSFWQTEVRDSVLALQSLMMRYSSLQNSAAGFDGIVANIVNILCCNFVCIPFT